MANGSLSTTTSTTTAGATGRPIEYADDQFASEQVGITLGDTPGKARTRRGLHFQYRDTGFDFGKLNSLKACGINADVRHGNSIVVAPWSRHQDDHSSIFSRNGMAATR